MPENLETPQSPVLRRRKGDQGIEETIRLENGEKIISPPEKNDPDILREQEKRLAQNKAMTEKLAAEIKGFLKNRNSQ